MNPSCDLQSKRCLPCEGEAAALAKNQIDALLDKLNGWKLNPEATIISRRFTFKGFYKTMAFVNAVAFIANQENHHPDMEVGYNYCVIHYTTHAMNGLSENDFICAAKVDALQAE